MIVMDGRADFEPRQSRAGWLSWPTPSPAVGAAESAQETTGNPRRTPDGGHGGRHLPLHDPPPGEGDPSSWWGTVLRPNPESVHRAPTTRGDIPPDGALHRRRQDLGALVPPPRNREDGPIISGCTLQFALGQDPDLRLLQPVHRRRARFQGQVWHSGTTSGRLVTPSPLHRPRPPGQAESGRRPG